jgi:putative ABC transport system ATP-binding protein
VTALFDFHGVRLAKTGTVILHDVTAAVPEDGLTVVAGRSGAGKSTLLRLCNRLEVPDRGVVRFRGTDLAGVDPLTLRRRVGMVFQRPSLFPGTVRDNLHVADPAATEEALTGVMARVELDGDFLDRVGDELSGGEAQRVCLARTLVTGPEVLLMDEPTSSLDPGAVRTLERLARTLTAGGVPTLWVTHDVAQLRRLADHLLVLDAGRAVFAGPADDPDLPAALTHLGGEEA